MTEKGDTLFYEQMKWHRYGGPRAGEGRLSYGTLTCAGLRLCLLTGYPLFPAIEGGGSSGENAVSMMYAVGRSPSGS